MSDKDITYQVCLVYEQPEQEEALRAFLARQGMPESSVAAVEENRQSMLCLYFNSRGKALALKQKVTAFRLPGIAVSLGALKKEEWLTRWKEEFKPFKLTDTVRIVPAGLKKKKHGRNTIFIDTDIAFGTGLHPTTKFMAEFIETEAGKFNDFFDVGTGTGILSLVARLYGAERIWAVDIDRKAVETAGRNFALNRCPVEFLAAVDFRDFSRKARFDFVAANLLTNDLVKFASRLKSFVRPGRYLAVSGISLSNYAYFRDSFNARNLTCLRIKKGSGWCALLYRKNPFS